MNDDDRDLREAFARLRDAERGAIPPFHVKAAHRRVVPRLAYAVLVLLLLVVGGYVARKARHEIPASNVTLSTWRAPTDFLLKTPGRELLDSTPRLQPQAPAINTTGGRS